MKTIPLVALALLLVACAPGGPATPPGPHGDEERGEIALPVRVALPGRGLVEDYVETQAYLDVDRRADVYAEVDGRVVARVRDLGDRVGEADAGPDALLLARLDDREQALALDEARIRLREQEGRVEELKLGLAQATREIEQARVTLQETEAAYGRTSVGIRDGTISIEEHERATFARNLARAKVEGAQTTIEKAGVALTLGSVAVEQARVAVARAGLTLEKTVVSAPFPGLVTFCDVRVGERVRAGDHLYRVEDPSTLVLFADLPVRQAVRVQAGNPVRVSSTATPGTTHGETLLVAPTVERESGTVRVKIRVEPAEGFRPGLFVTVNIVVETRANAVVVPRRAVLHHDEEGTYVFLVRDGRAVRTLVRTGFQRDDLLEVVEGLDEDAQVVVEGQDTLTHGARVEIQPS